MSSSYRYGFQGQEKNDELKGNGNSINYKYRIHDSRLGRFLLLGPFALDYQNHSSYTFSENRVTDAAELEVLEADVVHFQTPKDKIFIEGADDIENLPNVLAIASQRLNVVHAMKTILQRINPLESSEIIKLGSLVITNQANYYLSVSAGEFKIENTSYYAVSASSPIGKLLLGKQVGDSFVFNKEFKIEAIL